MITIYEYFRSVLKAASPTIREVLFRVLHRQMVMSALSKFESMGLYPLETLKARRPWTDTMQISIQSQTAAIDSVVQFFQRRLGDFCQSRQLAPANVSVCLREALANAIIHGNLEIPSTIKEASWEQFEALVQEREALPEFAARQVTIHCQMTSTEVRLDITDQGQGFDPTAFRLAELKRLSSTGEHDFITALPRSGRGLFIITALMDRVFWNDSGNRITMIKSLAPPEKQERP